MLKSGVLAAATVLAATTDQAMATDDSFNVTVDNKEFVVMMMTPQLLSMK